MSGMELSAPPFDAQLGREWLVTNGLGGFASSTIPCLNTRKYHGLLVAAMSPPVRQMVLLSRVEEWVRLRGKAFALSSCEYPGVVHPQGYESLRAFSAEPFPRWAYQGDGWTIERRLRMLPGENTVCLSYTLLAGDSAVELDLKPLFALRGIHDLMYQWNGRLLVENNGSKALPYRHHRVPATNRTPEVFFAHDGRFESPPHWYLNTIYRREQERGYAGLEDVWMAGTVRYALRPGQSVHFACSTDPIDLMRIISEIERSEVTATVSAAPAVADQKPDTTLQSLVRAASQFVVQGGGNGPERATRIMAGYPWSPPAGRDSLISFAGLLLVTGKLTEARSLLQLYASLEQRGLMPSEFPWDASPPRYLASDVSLWFVNAVWQYLRYGGESAFVLRQLLPVIESILRHYRAGTSLGIRADADGLLVARDPGTPTTWMDAKTGDWVITPRYGRAVEVNALWYNAQRIAAALFRADGLEARCVQMLAAAEATKAAFNRRFWNERLGCCHDVVDEQSNDAAVRPNQVLALSLPFPVLAIDRHQAVLDVVRRELLTPFGLRTLSPRHPHYTGEYAGSIDKRDKAYHQGSVFPWLLGPYVSAVVRVRGRSRAAREELAACVAACAEYIGGEGLGQLCELFDGDSPHAPGGLRASARSVGELLRCYVEDILDLAPTGGPVDSMIAAPMADDAAIKVVQPR
jgi:predicted glycogen debranching enzyme